MELSLKEAVKMKKWDMKEPPSKEFNYTREQIAEAEKVLLSFCQSVLECEGMPEKKDCECGTYCNCGAEDYNEACDLWQAYHAKMLDVERIAKIIDLYNGDDCPIDGNKVSWDEYKKHFATAIVAELKGEK